MQSKKSLFFSYGHDHYAKFVFTVKTKLEQQGFNVFIDNEKLHVGIDWENTLENAIVEYEKFVFFITEYSARRPDGYCLNEVALAILLNKNIIPVLLENQKLPLSIIRLQYIDFKDIVNSSDEHTVNQKIEYLISVLNGKKKLDGEGIQATLLSKLDPIDFIQDFRKHKIIGREWVIDKVNTLLSQNNSSRVLWITADAGYGKSAIAAYLAEFHPDVIGIHFCTHSSPEKKDPISIIKTLAFHFQSQIDGYYDEIKFVDTQGKSADRLMDDLILNPLERLTDLEKQYIFIIDGVDEAGIGDENLLVDLIYEKFHAFPKQIKIIITSRREPYIQQALSRYKPIELKGNQEENILDCKLFIEKKLKENQYKIKDSSILIQNLIEQSESNMLYLVNFFESVNEGYIKIDDPTTFPEGLNSFYLTYFHRKFPLIKDYDKNYAPILEQIVLFSGKMNNVLLAKILGLSQAQINNRIYDIGTLLNKDDQSYFVFYHKSLEDWLLRTDNKYQIDLERSHKNLDNFFMTYDEEIFLIHQENIYLHYLFISFCLRENKTRLLGKYLDAFEKTDVLLSIINLFIEEEKYTYADKLLKYIEPRLFLNQNINDGKLIKELIQLQYYKLEVHKHLKKKIKYLKSIKKIDSLIWIHEITYRSQSIKDYANLIMTIYESQSNSDIWNMIKNFEKKLNTLDMVKTSQDLESIVYWKEYKTKIYEIKMTKKVVPIPKLSTFIIFSIISLVFSGLIGGYTGSTIDQTIIFDMNTSNRSMYQEKDAKVLKEYSPVSIGMASVGESINIIMAYKNNDETNRSLIEEVIPSSIATSIPGIGILLSTCVLFGVETWICLSFMGAVILIVITLGLIMMFYYRFNKKRKKKILKNLLNSRRKLVSITKSFEQNPQQWIYAYIETIEYIAGQYDKIKKTDRIQKIVNKHWNIIENLYQSNPSRWKEVYNKIYFYTQ